MKFIKNIRHLRKCAARYGAIISVKIKGMIRSRVINEVLFDNDHLIIIVDAIRYKIKLDDVSVKLKNAEESQRLLYKVSPSGYGIHWPLIDEDLAVEKLIEAATANT